MLLKKSRYQPAHRFEPLANGTVVFNGIRVREIKPATGVIEHQVKTGDRLDHLAQQYYNNDRLWWRIVDANPDIIFAGNMLSEAMNGSIILIPKITE
jgi:phage tail protein X